MIEEHWYELIPAPGDEADDQTRFLKRARRAADELGLTGRPGLSDWWRSRDDGLVLVAQGERRWIMVPRGERAAKAFAHAARATIRACERPGFLDEEDGGVTAHALAAASSTLSRSARDDQTDDSDVRLDPPEDGWTGVNVRRIAWLESNRNNDWLADEFNRQADDSKLRGEGLSVCRVVAHAPDRTQALEHARNTANALDLGLTPGINAHISHPGLGLPLIGAVLILLGLMGAALGLNPLLPLTGLPLLAYGIHRRRNIGPAGSLMQRPRHRWWLARTRRAQSSDLKTRSAGDDQNVGRKHRVKAYAFQRSTFPLPAGALAAIGTPPARLAAAISGLTPVPDGLARADGMPLGLGDDNRLARIPRAAHYGGVAILGEAGSGKSNLMHGMQAWMRAHHGPGDCMVMIESKGSASHPILDRLVPGMQLVDVSDPTTPMVSLLGDGDNAAKAARFADLMQRALGDQQVGPQSRIQIKDATHAALEGLRAPGYARRCQTLGIRPARDWTDLASRLCCADGPREARLQGQAIRLECDDPTVGAALDRLHGGQRADGKPILADGRLAELLRAPMNKLDLLRQEPALAGRRPQVTWGQAIAHHAILMVNIGPAVRARQDGSHATMPDNTRRLVGAILFQSLRDEVERRCVDWQNQGRAMRVTVDELTDVTGDDPTGTDAGGGGATIRWMRERGRAYGVELTMGTQNPGQLSGPLLDTFLGMMTLCSFTLRAQAMAEKTAGDMGLDPGVLKGMRVHDMAVRTVDADLAGLPTLVLRVPHYDAGEHTDA